MATTAPRTLRWDSPVTENPAYEWPGFPSREDAIARVGALTELLKSLGWEEVPVGRYERFEQDVDSAPVLQKIFEGEFGEGPRTKVRLRVNPRTLVFTVGISAGNSVGFYMGAATITGPGHPHASGSVCYRTGVSGRTYAQMPPAFMATALAANVEAFWTNLNPHSILNHQYGVCNAPGCGQIVHNGTARHCPNCGGNYHRTCECLCVQAERALNIPTTVPRWRFAAQRQNHPTTTAEYRLATLLGCGVTGSWAALVLNRRFAAVHAYDPDRIALGRRGTETYVNRNGAWVANMVTRDQIRDNPGKPYMIERIQSMTHQNAAVRTAEDRAFGNIPDRPISMYNANEAGFVYPSVVVICVDSARARQKIVAGINSEGITVLDVRATPESVVFWSLPAPKIRLRGEGSHHTAPHDFRGRICPQCMTDIGRRVCDVWAFPGRNVALHTQCVADYKASTEGNPWMAWWDSLDRYEDAERERCADHHDAVAMGAGVTTAYFLTWWLDNAMPLGVWSIPLDPMSRVLPETTEVPNAAQA